VGLASYSLRKLPLDKAIEACKQAGVTSLAVKDMHLPMNDPPEKLKAGAAAIKAAGIAIVGGGVINMKPKAGAAVDAEFEGSVRKAFEYARTCGFPLIIASPVPEALDVVEKMVKEFDLPVAIHNHGPEDKLYPAPLDVLALIKKRDRRLGVCMDIGHTVRAGADPIKSALACGPRLFDLHVKDLADGKEKKSQVAVGRGVIDVVGLFRTLQKMKYAGHLALEYEVDEPDPLPGIRESLGYMRGVVGALGAA
jgi:sugar phosphate isomerase/epimerase